MSIRYESFAGWSGNGSRRSAESISAEAKPDDRTFSRVAAGKQALTDEGGSLSLKREPKRNQTLDRRDASSTSPCATPEVLELAKDETKIFISPEQARKNSSSASNCARTQSACSMAIYMSTKRFLWKRGVFLMGNATWL